MSYSVAAKVPAGIASIGVPVASEGALPKGVSLSRATLESLGFTGKLAVLWSIDKVKLRGAVVPGDQLRIEVETLRMKGEMGQVKGTGSVAGRVVCEASLMFTMLES